MGSHTTTFESFDTKLIVLKLLLTLEVVVSTSVILQMNKLQQHRNKCTEKETPKIEQTN